jgi:hypothetical protein
VALSSLARGLGSALGALGLLWVLAACDAAELVPSDAGVAQADAGATSTDARADDAALGTADARSLDAGEGPDAGDSSIDSGALEADAGPAPDGGAASDSGTRPEDEIDPTRSLHLLFIGNSFTYGGPVPTLVDLLANDAGWLDPTVEYSAFGGESLEGHRARTQTLALVDRGGWDVVVLQELSTRPTDSLGDPARFKADATWFTDRVRQTSPGARIVLYETWARHPNHPYYPTNFRDPGDMQAQLRTHYEDAALRYIPANMAVRTLAPPELARVGDTWERHLAGPGALRLHDTDDYHAGANGQYLNALVLYGMIYRRAVQGRTPWMLPLASARALQADADAVTGWTQRDGPPRPALPVGLVPGQRVRLDLGDTPSTAPGWRSLGTPAGGVLLDLRTSDDAASTVDVHVTVDFGGVNGVGLAANTLGYPAEASRDSFFAGSFTDHADGLLHPGQLTVRGLDPAGRYTLVLFASRAGDDGGLGRLTRYEVLGDVAYGHQDLDAADNTGRVARYERLAPSSTGELVIDVAVSPDGGARFAYLGVLELLRE